jgi:two-component system heavy metal sensor histidine kinase CusS
LIRWQSRSLTARTTTLFAFVACLIVFGLGAFLYMSARNALETSTDYALAGRVEHFRTLLADMYNIEQLEARPALFETMLGSEHDVFIFRRPGQTPFIRINPDHLTVPDLIPVPIGSPMTRAALYSTPGPHGVEVRWAMALATASGNGGVVEIIAAHVMTQEASLLQDYYRRVFLTSVIAALATALLAYLALTHGLRPLRAMAGKAAEITPKNLATRLRDADAPVELRQLAGAFNAMLDRLADGYERLSQFSADLAHEIRTPIGVLIGQTQVTLAQPRSIDEYQSVLESNLEELERLARIVENILFLAQADHDGFAIETAPLVIADELDNIADYFEGLAEERSLSFAIEASGQIHVNAMLWRRAINNLVVNAVRYATSGTTLRLLGHQDEQGATVTVENLGPPLAAEQLNRLFDRFYRGDAARSVFTESNGLGLAIVRAIMTLHGGSADVTCSEQGCIRFTLHFPCAAAA